METTLFQLFPILLNKQPHSQVFSLCDAWGRRHARTTEEIALEKRLVNTPCSLPIDVYVYVYMYIYKFSPRGFSEPIYKYIQGQTVEGLRKSA